MRIVIFLLLLPCFLFSLEVIENEKYNIVFPSALKHSAVKMSKLLDKYMPLYNKYYNYTPQDKILFNINGIEYQKANASSLFNKINIFYGTYNALEYDLLATNEYAKLLLMHELSHSYQMLSTKKQIKRSIFSYDTSLFLEPNVFLPNSLIEGNAVLMESLLINGGRLYSGYARAILNSTVFSGKLDLNLLLLHTREFPYYDTRYLISGFFMKYLYDKYGLVMLNSYFLEHSSSYFRPLSLNFEDHFNDSFENVFNDFIAKQKEDKFIRTKGELIAESSYVVDLNKQDGEVYFLTRHKKKNNMLNIFNISNSSLKQKKSKFVNARVFKIDNEFYYSSIKNIDDKVLYGLYSDDIKPLKNSQSKIWTKIIKGDNYYYDVNNSFDSLKLYKNNNFLYEMDSSNIVVDSNDLYYFKSIDKKRWLFKNNEKLFGILGHYAFVVDFDDRFIYFISNSSYGSSLFSWDKENKKIQRVLKGDDIYQAKKISKDGFLVAVVGTNSQQVLKIKQDDIKNDTSHEDYQIAQYDYLIKTNTNTSTQNKKIEIKKYNPLMFLNINKISLALLRKKAISIEIEDVSENILVNASLEAQKNQYLYSIKYKNKFYKKFKHQMSSLVDGHSNVLLANLVYIKTLMRKSNKMLNFHTGYTYNRYRYNTDSLFILIKYQNKTYHNRSSYPSGGYEGEVYANKIILDGVNIKAKYQYWKSIHQDLFLRANLSSAFSSSNLLKNKISIEDAKFTNEHIKSQNYPSNKSFNKWVAKAGLGVDYEKYLGLYSKYYISLVELGFSASYNSFATKDRTFNENILALNGTFLLGYNQEIDFSFKKIYNDIFQGIYRLEISMEL